jgi:hypothetical protein
LQTNVVVSEEEHTNIQKVADDQSDWSEWSEETSDEENNTMQQQQINDLWRAGARKSVPVDNLESTPVRVGPCSSLGNALISLSAAVLSEGNDDKRDKLLQTNIVVSEFEEPMAMQTGTNNESDRDDAMSEDVEEGSTMPQHI